MSIQNQPAAFKTVIGGQALIEGIVMMGPDKKCIVVRKPEGDLEIKTEARTLIKDRWPVLGLPLIRGVVNFGSSMVHGVKALMFSASFFPDDEPEENPSKFDRWVEEKLGSEKAASVFVSLAVVLGLCFSIGLFFLLPTFLADLVTGFFRFGVLARSLTAGAARIVIFVSYLILCSHMKDMKRVFSYHGAEHKAIFCYEQGLPLTLENVRAQPKHHPRCGTSFLFVVIILSVLIFSGVFSVVHPPNVFVRMLIQLAMLPLVVSIAYEINRLVGRYSNPLTRFLTAPGLWLQNWTTNEPDDSMIEVGITALEQVLPNRQGADEW